MRRFLVTLVATCLVAAGAAAGVVGSAGSAAASAPQQSSGDDSLAGAQKLIQYVPEDARSSCFRVDAATQLNKELAHVLGAVRCTETADHVGAVTYLLEPDGQTDDEDFASIGSSADTDNQTDDCPLTSVWNYDDGTGGTKSCGQLNGATQIVWTATAQNIIGLTQSDEQDITALNDWFNNSSGPTETPDESVEFAPTSRSGRTAAGKALVKQAGDVTKCKQNDVDVSTLTKGGLAWEWLPWASAYIVCASPQHQGPVEFFQLTADTAGEFEPHLVETNVGDAKPKKSSSFCADGVYHGILDKKGNHVGQIQCFYEGSLMWAAWYFDSGPSAGVVGSMPADHFTNPEKFFKFLSDNSII